MFGSQYMDIDERLGGLNAYNILTHPVIDLPAHKPEEANKYHPLLQAA